MVTALLIKIKTEQTIWNIIPVSFVVNVICIPYSVIKKKN